MEEEEEGSHLEYHMGLVVVVGMGTAVVVVVGYCRYCMVVVREGKAGVLGTVVEVREGNLVVRRMVVVVAVEHLLQSVGRQERAQEELRCVSNVNTDRTRRMVSPLGA